MQEARRDDLLDAALGCASTRHLVFWYGSQDWGFVDHNKTHPFSPPPPLPPQGKQKPQKQQKQQQLSSSAGGGPSAQEMRGAKVPKASRQVFLKALEAATGAAKRHPLDRFYPFTDAYANYYRRLSQGHPPDGGGGGDDDDDDDDDGDGPRNGNGEEAGDWRASNGKKRRNGDSQHDDDAERGQYGERKGYGDASHGVVGHDIVVVGGGSGGSDEERRERRRGEIFMHMDSVAKEAMTALSSEGGVGSGQHGFPVLENGGAVEVKYSDGRWCKSVTSFARRHRWMHECMHS